MSKVRLLRYARPYWRGVGGHRRDDARRHRDERAQALADRAAD